MSDRILLSPESSQRLEAAADLFVQAMMGIVGNPGIQDEEVLKKFRASVSAQALFRALYRKELEEAGPLIFAGLAEGIGMVLGLMEDANSRQMVFAQAVATMAQAIKAQAVIHTPQGST